MRISVKAERLIQAVAQCDRAGIRAQLDPFEIASRGSTDRGDLRGRKAVREELDAGREMPGAYLSHSEQALWVRST